MTGRGAEHRLITLSFSHYNDKARWALEHCAVPFVEEPHMPGLSSLAVAVATRGRGGRADRVSTRFSTPFVICADGRYLSDSTAIARFASSLATPDGEPDRLFPSERVGQLVERFSDQLGPYTRLVSYFHALRHPGLLGDLGRRNVSPREARLFSALYPVGQRWLARSLGLTRARVERAMGRINAELDFALAQRDASGFLAEGRFTAADLTFAAMVAPALLVTRDEGYGGALPELAALDADARALVKRYREHPAGQFALQMYRDHRAR